MAVRVGVGVAVGFGVMVGVGVGVGVGAAPLIVHGIAVAPTLSPMTLHAVGKEGPTVPTR
ncbi:hypothetical protein [Cryobacterium roopkundense]|uniref:hypothetical protein n=1 Tax=Cryobacterium roopkundense TaxID=1001240 RepID=UPI000B074251|nr:hypothetical protein [Cryobacterium roopkundense]